MPLSFNGEPRAKLVEAMTIAKVRCTDTICDLHMLHYRGHEMEDWHIDQTLEHARALVVETLAAIDEARLAWMGREPDSKVEPREEIHAE